MASLATFQFSPWFMLQTNSLSCVCSLHSPTLVYHWQRAGDSFCFYAIMLCVYFSEMSTRQQRMMLKIIQINSFLFLLIRPSPISWMTVNRIICCYLNPVFLAHAALQLGWIHVHHLPGGVHLVHCHLCLWGQQQVSQTWSPLVWEPQYATVLSSQWYKISLEQLIFPW